MADLNNKPRSPLHTIIHGAAELIARQEWVPPQNRAAMRAAAVSIFEQQICAVIGYDSLVINGWVMPPSARQARRDRIEAALAAGESPKVIAGRELVSPRWVLRIQAEMRAGEQIPPEQFTDGRPQ